MPEKKHGRKYGWRVRKATDPKMWEYFSAGLASDPPISGLETFEFNFMESDAASYPTMLPRGQNKP